MSIEQPGRQKETTKTVLEMPKEAALSRALEIIKKMREREIDPVEALREIARRTEENSEVELKKTSHEAPIDVSTVAREIADQISSEVRSMTREQLGKRQKQVVAENEKQMPPNMLDRLFYGNEDDIVVGWADTSKIIERPGFWRIGEDYDSKPGQIAAVAEVITKGNEQDLERLFRANSEPTYGQITLKALDGPAGPVYFIQDGSHRVSAAMVAGLEKIPAQIKRRGMDENGERGLKETAVPIDRIDVANKWQKMIDVGLIDGVVKQESDQFKLEIKKEVLPWMHAAKGSWELGQVYENIYPGSLDNIRSLKTGEVIPKEVLVREGAFWAWAEENSEKKNPEQGEIFRQDTGRLFKENSADIAREFNTRAKMDLAEVLPNGADRALEYSLERLGEIIQDTHYNKQAASEELTSIRQALGRRELGGVNASYIVDELESYQRLERILMASQEALKKATFDLEQAHLNDENISDDDISDYIATERVVHETIEDLVTRIKRINSYLE